MDDHQAIVVVVVVVVENYGKRDRKIDKKKERVVHNNE